MVQIGVMIREDLQKQNKSVLWLAENLKCNRSHVYRMFARNSMDTKLLLRISRLLQHDYFADLSNDLFLDS